jgi:cyclophilin family peptidyl-prolyl cis-trans isomerase
MKGFIGACIAIVLAVAWAEPAAAQGAAQGRGGTATAQPPARGRAATAPTAKPTTTAGNPVIVFETTSKGAFEIETYPAEAPKTVEHILTLVRRNFYNGQRFHRVVPGFVVQWGDPFSRDFTKKAQWGTGGSGRAIGVAEINPKRTHRLGAVAMAHAGDPRQADSQMYVALAPQPRLDGDYTVFGQVVAGMEVVQKLEIGDVIRRATVKGAAPAPARGATTPPKK